MQKLAVPVSCHNTPTMALRDYQVAPANTLLSHLREQPARKVLAVAPVGFGKTVLFSWIAAQFVRRGGKVLVLAHREELLDQIRSKMEAFGLSTATEKASQRVDVAALPDVTVASVQTLKGARLARFDPSTYALIVVDEAHHVRKGDAYCRVFDHCLAAPVLGVTGTPKRLDGLGLGDVFTENPVTIGLDEGIQAGWLVTPRVQSYHVKGYKLDTVRTVAGEYNAADIERELLDSPILHAAANIVQDACQDRRTLVFTPTVRTANELAAALATRGMRALAVSGDMPKPERVEATRKYRAGEVDIAVNCMLWTEGFDVPETDCVVLLRPTKSTALMTQMIGRGLRLHPGKTECLLIEVEPELVSKKLFARPENCLGGGIPLKREDKGKYDDKGTVEEPELPKVIESIETDADIASKTYAALMGRQEPANDSELTDTQRATLALWGFTPSKVKTRTEFEQCARIVRDRQNKGLCSVKIGKKLQGYGLNPNVSHQLGCEAMAAISQNKWRPPSWMYQDPRYAKKPANTNA